MQISSPRKCPDCDHGKKGLKLCRTCRGSGWVHLVPAERVCELTHPTLSEMVDGLREEDIYG